MGRFSKLETNTPPPDPADGARLADRLRKAGADKSADARSAGATPEYDGHHYQSEGDRLFFSGEYAKALRMYSRAIQADHSAIDPWVGQIRCLLEMKQPKEALVWMKRALELFPEEPRLISLQAVGYAMSGMVERGLGCSDYALRRPGQTAADPLVWICRGTVLLLAESRNADPCFAKALETRQRDDWQTPMSLGMVMLNQRRWARAAEFLELAVESQSRNAHLWERLGFARERMGLGQAAMEAYQAALDLNAGNRAADDGIVRLQTSSVWRRLARRLFG